MSELQTMIADFVDCQAERSAARDREFATLKAAILPLLKTHDVASVTVRFEGYGDSGAIEDTTCLYSGNSEMPCPDVMVEITERDPMKLASAVEELAYSALEKHHPGWEINDGAHGELIIDVARATVQLDCNLRYTAYDSHSTEL